MPLHPKIRSMLESRSEEVDPATLSVAQLRSRALEALDRWRLAGVSDYEVGSCDDVDVDLDGVRLALRVYRPGPATARRSRGYPIIVYLHGGGWVLGDLDTHDGICRAVCSVAGAIVVSVGYRLAPEHPYPIPLQDCERAVRWAHTNALLLGGDPYAVFIAGDSAGGNLAAVCALNLCGQLQPELRGEILIYPAVDDPFSGHASMEEFKVGNEYGQSFELLNRMMNLYVGNSIPLSHPGFAPIRADSVACAPPTLVITAEYDMLRDEGEAYARRLESEGVDVVVKRFEGVNHGFMHFTKCLPATDAAFELIADWVRSRLGAQRPRDSALAAGGPGRAHL